MNEDQTNNEACEIGRALITAYELWRDFQKNPDVKKPIESAFRYTLEAIEMLNRKKDLDEQAETGE